MVPRRKATPREGHNEGSEPDAIRMDPMGEMFDLFTDPNSQNGEKRKKVITQGIERKKDTFQSRRNSNLRARSSTRIYPPKSPFQATSKNCYGSLTAQVLTSCAIYFA